MPFFEAIRLAFQTIRAQKLKSVFSIVGVFIGVMFLIAVVSVVQGMNRYMTEKFAGTILGVNTFRLRRFPDVQIGNVTDSMWRSWLRRPRITYDDAQAVVQGVTTPVLTAWESSTRATLTAGRQQAKDVQGTAATEPFFDIRSRRSGEGRAFTPREVQAGVAAALLGGARGAAAVRASAPPPAGGERSCRPPTPRPRAGDGGEQGAVSLL